MGFSVTETPYHLYTYLIFPFKGVDNLTIFASNCFVTTKLLNIMIGSTTSWLSMSIDKVNDFFWVN